MRIALIIDEMHPRNGGPPAVVAGSAIALRKKGHDVRIITLDRHNERADVARSWQAVTNAGVQFHFIKDNSLSGHSFPKSLVNEVGRQIENVDVVHIHGVWNRFFVVVAKISRKKNKPYFVSSHGIFDHRAMRYSLYKYIKKRAAISFLGFGGLLKNANGLIFGSKAELTESWLPYEDLPVYFVPNGLDAALGSNDPSPEQMRRLHTVVPELKNWKRIVLVRSRIHREKGHDKLVSAFERVADEFPDVGLLIAGLKQVESYEAEVRSLISSSRHRDRIALTTDLVGPENYFVSRVASIYAAPSTAEGFSVSLIEGLANGKPMLITRYCHMPTVEEANAGVIVEATVPDLERGLRKLLSLDNASFAKMGQTARKLFENNYTWDKVADTLLQTYSNLSRATKPSR
jgi:glycosyltransferase involved in cell wall biosynthesis